MLCSVKPLQSLDESMSQIQKASMTTGDNLRLCIGRTFMNSVQFWRGSNLSDLKGSISSSLRIIKKREHKHAILPLMILENTVSALADKTVTSTYDEFYTKLQQIGYPIPQSNL